jgi:transcriptional regulator with XRE-family HTH domain
VPADPVKTVRHVGRRVAELRRAAGITQAQLAEKMGVSIQYVSRIELGTNLTLHTLVKLANVFRVMPADLLLSPSREALVVNRGRPRKNAR